MANYNTYLTSKPELLKNNCSRIQLILDNISKANSDILQNFIDKNSKVVAESSRTKDSDSNTFPAFKITKDKISGEKFNVIIYFNNSGEILGYTKFNDDIEYSNADIYISTDFKINAGTTESSLSDILIIDDFEKLGTNPYQYTSLEKILKEKEEYKHISGYTTSLEGTLRDGSCILNRQGIVRYGQLQHLDFSTGFYMVDSLMSGFDNFNLGSYKGGIALYGWRKRDSFIDVRAVSLSKQNLFGHPTLLTRKGSGYIEIPAGKLGVNGVRYCAGRFVALEKISSNTPLLFNLENESVEDVGNDFIIDSYDRSCRVTTISESLCKVYPELNDVDTPQFLYAKYGSCGILKNTGGLIYRTPYFEYKPTKSSSTVLIVNEKTILYEGENSWMLKQDGKEDEAIDLEKPYKSSLIYFRRNQVYPGKIKKFIAAYKGLIYYITDDNKINFI